VSDIAANRKLLTAALRSGEYEQGKIHLRKEDKHCCLGVGCEVYQKHVGDLVIEVSEEGVRSYDGCNAYLPEKVREFYGFTGSAAFLPHPVADLKPDYSKEEITITNLVCCNDSLSMTFTEIADFIDNKAVFLHPSTAAL